MIPNIPGMKIIEMGPTKPERTIQAHYGVKQEKYDRWVREILCDMINSKWRYNVIDKHFEEIKDTDLRCKILAYANACDIYRKVAGSLPPIDPPEEEEEQECKDCGACENQSGI